jgi:hypothetical protein
MDDENQYKQHIDNCISSGICILLRGNREFCYIFCDYLHSGNIICFINASLYKHIGLEKFGFDDIFYFFDINEHSLEFIHDTMINALNDKDNIIRCKNKIKKFYESFIKIDKAYSKKYSYHGGYNRFTHFIIYKLYDILNNNYNLVDNKILRPEANKIVYN